MKKDKFGYYYKCTRCKRNVYYNLIKGHICWVKKDFKFLEKFVASNGFEEAENALKVIHIPNLIKI